MDNRTCEHCGTSINLLRAGAKFCSTKCRVYASRKPRLPREMTDSARWLRWKATKRAGKMTKRPVTVTGASGSSTDPSTWATYAAANASKVGNGLGFALGEGIGCIDLDHCFKDGVMLPWAQAIVDRCPETFMEVSQSGEGLHIFGYLPEGGGRNMRDGEANVEFYSMGRFIAVTGNRYGKAPSKLADLAGVVASVL